MTSAQAIARLSKVSWEFPEAQTRNLTHGYHPFHGKFIPQIPRTIIEHLTKEGDIVLDPFCGSGTSLVEANILGRNAIGSDISPIAVLVSKVKTTFIDPSILLAETNKMFQALTSKKIKSVIPKFPDNDIWYNKKTLEDLGKLWSLILKYQNKNKDLFDFFQVAFSSVLKTVANRSEHWNWAFIGDNILPKIDKYVVRNKFFFNTVNSMIAGMEEFGEEKSDKSIKILQVDTRHLSRHLKGMVNLIITSPPYCFAVDFNRYYRLSYYWFGWEIDSHRDIEIGARSKRGKKDAINVYFSDMEKSISELYKVLAPGGYCCFTLGDTKRDNQIIAAVDRTIEMAKKEGFKVIDHTYRELSKQSMAQKRIPQESVLIFKK
jgi:SAM-dependent methyltransferase